MLAFESPLTQTLCVKNKMELATFILFLLAPFPVVIWSIYTKKSTKKIISYSLITALIFGTILQVLTGGQAHVPGSEVILIAFELFCTACVLILYFSLRFIYEKYKNT